MKYRWIRQLEGMPYVSADVVGPELRKLEEQNGGTLLPSTVVRAARPKKSKLHQCFEWSDKKAAEAFRQRQAREILRKIAVEYEEQEGEPKTIRAFVSIKSEDGGRYYCQTRRLRDDAELHANVMAQILQELLAIKAKYAIYKIETLQAIWDAIDEAVLQ